MVARQYEEDVRVLIAKRRDNGSDFWAAADGRWGVGSPFSTFDCAIMLSELGLKRTDPIMNGAAEVLFDAWQDDSRFRPAVPSEYSVRIAILARCGFLRSQRRTLQNREWL